MDPSGSIKVHHVQWCTIHGWSITIMTGDEPSMIMRSAASPPIGLHPVSSRVTIHGWERSVVRRHFGSAGKAWTKKWMSGPWFGFRGQMPVKSFTKSEWAKEVKVVYSSALGNSSNFTKLVIIIHISMFGGVPTTSMQSRQINLVMHLAWVK